MNKAIQTIQNEAHLLTTVRVLAAIESCDWVALSRLAERLGELAERGLYHNSLERAKSMASFAMGNHAEVEPR